MYTIYSRKNCSQCQMAKRWFDVHHIEYKEVDIDKDNRIVLRLLEAGFHQLPVITDGKDAISGFDGEALSKFVNH